ncbi:MAG TPA: hypothetical protein PLN41_05030 [Methanothrix sp.]|nr:hypothetical protein [Methanothrix sp.]HPY72916.1 hypothetical protein [Methanothrix sp.]
MRVSLTETRATASGHAIRPRGGVPKALDGDARSTPRRARAKASGKRGLKELLFIGRNTGGI